MFVSIRRYSASKELIGNEEIERSYSHCYVNRFGFVFQKRRKKQTKRFFFCSADYAKMIDIDHETGSAYTENLNIPGEEAVLHEPNMDQIDHKLSAPNMTGKIFRRNSSKFSSFFFQQFIWTLIKSNLKGKNRSRLTSNVKIQTEINSTFSTDWIFSLFCRSKAGVWGMRSEKSETINGYQCKVYTANNFELVTRTRIEHMSEEDRKSAETGQSSHRNFLGGVVNFLESSATSKSTTAGAASKSSNVKKRTRISKKKLTSIRF